MQGVAELTFAVRDGRTCLVRSRTAPPLTVQRVLYLDEPAPDMAFLHLMNPTAGVFEGDTLRLDVRVCSGARAHLTTQAATRLHAMPDGIARQTTSIGVEKSGYLEYLPDPIIPFAGARFIQATEITVQPGATVVYGDIFLSGRVAHGESFAFHLYENRLTIRDHSHKPLFHEAYSLAPVQRSPFEKGILGDDRIRALGTFIVVADPNRTTGLDTAVRESLAGTRCATIGVSLLTGNRGIGLKILAETHESARSVFVATWRTVRRHLLSLELPAAWKR